jgi:hypothetical protein
MTTDTEWLTPAEVAEILGCHEKTVRRALNNEKRREKHLPGAELLNPGDAPQRWIWRIPDTPEMRAWRPKAGRPKDGDDAES